MPFPGIADLDSSNLMLRLAQARFDPPTPCLFCDPDEFLVPGPGHGVADLGVADLDLTGTSALVLPRLNVTGRLSQVLGDPDGVHPLGCLTIRIDARVARSHMEVMTGVLDSP